MLTIAEGVTLNACMSRQAGYMLHDRVLRPAEVGVVRQAPS